MGKTLIDSQIITQDLVDIGRECFYALRKLERVNTTVNVHLERILEILGISKPGDVGLSDGISRH